MLIKLARAAAPAQKIAAAAAMSRRLRSLAEAGVRARHPEAGADERRRQLAAVLLPAELCRKAFGFDPRREGY